MCAEFKWKLFVWIIWSGDELLELQRAPFRCKFVEKLSFWRLSLENNSIIIFKSLFCQLTKREQDGNLWSPITPKENHTAECFVIKIDILKHYLSFTVSMQTLFKTTDSQWGNMWWIVCSFLVFQPTKGKIFSLLCLCFRICSMCWTSSSQQFIFSRLFNVLNSRD